MRSALRLFGGALPAGTSEHLAAELVWLGISNYQRVLNDEAMWEHMRATAHLSV